MSRTHLLAAGVAALLLPLGLTDAQARPEGRGARPRVPQARQPAGRDTLRARADSAGAQADTTAARVKWAEPDSVTEELTARRGYNVTRYQADTVTFDAKTRTLSLDGRRGGVAAVQRDSQLVVADTGIIYSERTGEAVARGNLLFRDPGRNAADVVARGTATYNLRDRYARVTEGRTSVQSGETWFVSAGILAMIQAADSANGAATFYGVRGRLTSCDDTLHGPHYHFHFREIKRRGSFMVARPGILYIADVPVFWLPFVFQDMRTGRRSGVLTPRFGVSDIVRNSPTYRRNIENVGYYWAMNDYMDFELSFDWRSGTGGPAEDTDPGWMRFNGQWQYKWLERRLDGSIASSYLTQNDGQTNLAVSWGHRQSFTANRNVSANLNYVTSTALQRQNTFNPYTALATIRSSLNVSDRVGPVAVQLGGNRTQYPGRSEIQQAFPTLSLTSGAINLARWLVWTPGFQFNEQRTLNGDQTWNFATRFELDAEGDTVRRERVRRNSRNTSASLESPLQIFGFDLRNSFRYSDEEQDFPDIVRVKQVDQPYTETERIYARRFLTSLDWTVGFSLPGFSRGRWNVSPSVSLQNVDPDPFMVRSERTNGRWVSQSKRPVFGLSATPTFFGLIPGFFGYSRFRHSITPTLTYNFALKEEVSDAFLAATRRSRQGYLGSLAQNAVSLTLAQNIEGKVRSARDTNPEGGRKVKLLTLTFSPLSYDFERARKTGSAARGFTNSSFGYTARSELLPNVNLQVNYSLFQGDPLSDTARFSPYRTSVAATFAINQRNNPFAILTRLFGRAVPANTIPSAEVADPDSTRHDETRRLAVQPVAGGRARAAQFVVPAREGWEASFSFTSSRDRPPSGNANVIEYDPTLRCVGFRNVNPIAFQQCVEDALTNPSIISDSSQFTRGGVVYRSPPVTSLNSDINFHLTPKWAASWRTTYDFVRGDFASHIVSLQRDLHDWRAVFAFTQSPNGNFAFNFFIALKAQPDLKFDYNRATYRSGGFE
ncbi:MAG: putative LPS assembly protein LptD [Gemmatimonadaceae bacterium]